MANRNVFVASSLFFSLVLGGCASVPVEQPLTTSSPKASASTNPETNAILSPVVAALRDELLAAGKAGDLATYDLSGWFGSKSGYLGGLESGSNCNIAVFENSQAAFDARLSIGEGQYVSASGSFEGAGTLVFASNEIEMCASSTSGVITFLDEGLAGAGKKTWAASSSAIKDCWVNHIDCIEQRKLSVPVEAVDSLPTSMDALAKLVDGGYCITAHGDPHGWNAPGYLVCSATNGLNVYAAVGSSFVLPRVASVSNGFANSIIAGDGWVLTFDDGFTDKEIREAHKLAGGQLYSH